MIQNKKHRDISHSNNTQPICSTIKQRKNKYMVKAENEKIAKHIWVKVLKNEPSKIF